MNIQSRLPGICRAYIDMERCNGGINRYRTEVDALEYLERCITQDGLDVVMNLPKIDAYFAALSDDELLLTVDGDDDDRAEFMKNAPEGADQFLNAMFDRADA